MKQYGEVIIELRKEKGLSQKQLAEKLGVPVPTVARYEKNTNQPSLDVIKKMAKFFGISTSKFLELANKYDAPDTNSNSSENGAKAEKVSKATNSGAEKKPTSKAGNKGTKKEASKDSLEVESGKKPSEPIANLEEKSNSATTENDASAKEPLKEEKETEKQETSPKQDVAEKEARKEAKEEKLKEKQEKQKTKQPKTNDGKTTLGVGGFLKAKPWIIATALGVVTIILALCALLIPLKYSTSQILAKYDSTVFYIETENSFTETSGKGSGFFINNTGLGVTSYDNISSYTSGTIKLNNGEKHNITKIVGVDKENNIALIQTDVRSSKSASLGKTENIIRGNKVYVISFSTEDSLETAKSKITKTTITWVEENNGKVTEIQFSADNANLIKGGILLDEYGSVIALISGVNNLTRATTESVTFNCVPIEIVTSVKQDKNVTMEQHIVDEHGTYTISFNANGGEGTMQSQTALRDFDITLHANQFTKFGYDFMGWSLTNANNATKSFDDREAVYNIKEANGEITLYAMWQPTVYHIYYHYNGGVDTSDREGYLHTYTINDVGRTINLQRETKTGYTFIGWYETSDFSGEVIKPPYVIGAELGDIHLYVKFDVITYTVKYVLNGAENNPSNPTTYTVEDNITLLPAIFSQEGYEFKYWYTKSGEIETRVDVLNHTTGNKELHAKIGPKEFPIIYHLNGGVNSPDNLDFYTYETDNYNLHEPTRTGYIFDGWYTDENFSEDKKFEPIKKNSQGAINVYAKWTAKTFNLQLNVGNGTCDEESITVTYDDTFALPTAVSSKDGYLFEYWVAVYLDTKREDERIVGNTWVYDEVDYIKAHYAFIFTLSGSGPNKQITGFAEIAKNYQYVNVPEELEDGTKITSIKASAFANNANITQVNLPVSVTTIGENAFYGCTKLARVTMLGVETISKFAFANCQKLRSVELSKTTYIVDGTETTDTDTTPDTTVTKITQTAELENIGASAFENCTLLDGFYFPATVSEIGEDAFKSSGLRSIVFDEDCTLAYLPKNMFYNCSSLVIIENMPSSIETIGQNAFYNCRSLTEIDIPESVTAINASAFWGCSGLTEVNFTGSTDAWASIKFASLYSVPMRTSERLNITGNGAVKDSTTGRIDITFTSAISKINDYAFYNCRNITSVTIPTSIKTIGADAFSSCSLSKTYYLGTVDEWVEIDFETRTSNPISSSKNLYLVNTSANASVNDAPLAVDDDVNQGSDDNNSTPNETETTTFKLLENLEFSTATKISNYAFTTCNSLKTISLDGIKVIGTSAFEYCSGLTSVTISATVVVIGESAFYGCSGLEEVIFEENLSSEPQILSEDNLDNGGDNLGNGDENLGSDGEDLEDEEKEEVLPDLLTTLARYAFASCTKLKTVKLPSTLTEINVSCFSGCSNLVSIILPTSVKKIDDSAFNSCGSLTKIYYVGTKEEFAEIAVGAGNTAFTNATIYWYAKTKEETTETDNFWHYNAAGKVAEWNATKNDDNQNSQDTSGAQNQGGQD